MHANILDISSGVMVSVVIFVCFFIGIVMHLSERKQDQEVTRRRESEQKKADTIRAYNKLQEGAFDVINEYTIDEIQHISDVWSLQNQGEIPKDDGEFEELSADSDISEGDKCVKAYYELSGCLARIEQFALGVNVGVYDEETAIRLQQGYMEQLYVKKLKPLIDAKKVRSPKRDFYPEFKSFVEKMQQLNRE